MPMGAPSHEPRPTGTNGAGCASALPQTNQANSWMDWGTSNKSTKVGKGRSVGGRKPFIAWRRRRSRPGEPSGREAKRGERSRRQKRMKSGRLYIPGQSGERACYGAILKDAVNDNQSAGIQ